MRSGCDTTTPRALDIISKHAQHWRHGQAAANAKAATSRPHVPGTPAPQNPKTPGPQDPGTPGPRYPRTPVPQDPGTPGSAAGVLGSWGPGVLGSWGPGVLGSWGPGVLGSLDLGVPSCWAPSTAPWLGPQSQASRQPDTHDTRPPARAIVPSVNAYVWAQSQSLSYSEAFRSWTRWGLSPGPSACEADVIPLHHVPLTSYRSTPNIGDTARQQPMPKQPHRDPTSLGPQHPRTPRPRDPRTPVPQDPGTPGPRYPRTPVPQERRWGTGVLGSWGPGVLGSWGPGVLGSWGPGVLGSLDLGVPSCWAPSTAPWLGPQSQASRQPDTHDTRPPARAIVPSVNAYVWAQSQSLSYSEAFRSWTRWGLSPGPSACEADVIPLHHVPLTSYRSTPNIGDTARQQPMPKQPHRDPTSLGPQHPRTPRPRDPRTPVPQDPGTPGPRYPRTPVPQERARRAPAHRLAVPLAGTAAGKPTATTAGDHLTNNDRTIPTAPTNRPNGNDGPKTNTGTQPQSSSRYLPVCAGDRSPHTTTIPGAAPFPEARGGDESEGREP